MVVAGAVLGWLFVSTDLQIPTDKQRKYKSRSFSTSTPWRKMSDNDSITPFAPPKQYYDEPERNEKPLVDDYYAEEPQPVIGSRRALALARANAFNSDGSIRPESMFERNQAGLGAGNRGYGATAYGVDAQGRPFNPNAGGTPIAYKHDTRHIANLAPVAMGRPAVPTNDVDLDAHEDFADEPAVKAETSSDGYALPYDEPLKTATTVSSWSASDHTAQRNVSAPQAGRALPVIPRLASGGYISAVAEKAAMARSTTLPAINPISPLSSSFNNPMEMYAPEPATQKRMYGEVSRAAGFPEPLTPQAVTRSASSSSAVPSSNLNGSTSSHDVPETSFMTADSSFSTHNPLTAAPAPPYSPPKGGPVRLPPPPITLSPPHPYVHGQPLSPLEELPTPLSSNLSQRGPTTPALASTPSSRNLTNELNPFDRMTSSGTRNLLPPRGYVGTIPSIRYPPPSPSGMSVPGSVTDSPRRWSGVRGARGSVISDEDAYGGI